MPVLSRQCVDTRKVFSMRILKKRNILKLAATFMLVGMMAGAFAMQAKAAVASGNPPCTNTSSGTICDSNLTASVDEPNLLFTSTAPISAVSTHIGDNTFTLPATIIDNRPGATPTDAGVGWRLQAASPGMNTSPAVTAIILSTTTAVLKGDTTTGQCTFKGGTCSGVAFPGSGDLSIDTATPTTIASEDNTDIGVGTFVLNIPGSFTIPPTDLVGNYTGTITLSLLNTY